MTTDTHSIPAGPARRRRRSQPWFDGLVRSDVRARTDVQARADDRARSTDAGRPDDAARPGDATRPGNATQSDDATQSGRVVREGDCAGCASDEGRASRPVLADAETAPTWMRAVGGVVLTAGLALSAAVLAWPGDAPEVALIVTGAVAVVVGLLLLVARAGLTVTDTDVVLHFRPLPSRRIARRTITRARVVEADARTYGGVGLRLARRRRALILTPGAGVEFTDDRGRVTFVRTRCATAAIRVVTGREGRRDGRGELGREARRG